MSFKILLCDKVDKAAEAVLADIAHCDQRSGLSEDELVKIIGDYDALVVRSATTVTQRIIDAGEKLQIIGRAGVGVDNVNVKAATDRGIYVVNSPQGNTIAAAEHTLGLMFALSRHVSVADASLRKCLWERSKFVGSQLQGKILGIVGLGQVGSHVAAVAKEMGMILTAFDPYVNEARAAQLGVKMMALPQLLANADYVTLHVPLIPSTKHLINADSLKTMKKNARIINCSRGGVVDEAALCEALKSGTIAGAALDVFEVEKAFPADSTLLQTPNLLLTPHLGASTTEAQVNVAVDVAHQIKETLAGNIPQSAVNIPGIRAAELKGIKGLLRCCELLGRVACQMLTSPMESLTVTAEGAFAKGNNDALMMAAANGALGVFSSTRVNFVNVKDVAQKHKLSMKIAADQSAEKNAIRVDVTGGAQTASLRGTLTEEGEVLLKSFDDFPVYIVLPARDGEPSATAPNADDASPVSDLGSNFVEGKNMMLYSIHRDVPGTLAKITTVVSDAGINIANCHLGRNASHKAVAIFDVEGAVPGTVTDAMRNIDAVERCGIIRM